MISLMVGVTCRSRLIAWFAWRISTQTGTCPGDFGVGATTRGDTHGIGPSIRSTTPTSSSRFNCSFNCWRTWKGTLWWGWATGWTLSSMCSSSWYPLNFPRPWNSSSYFLTNSSTLVEYLREHGALLFCNGCYFIVQVLLTENV